MCAAGPRDYTRLLRGEHDAIMIGVTTLVADDPRLTVRHPNWSGKKIVRVILDSRLRFPLTAKILSTLPRGRILVFAGHGAPGPRGPPPPPTPGRGGGASRGDK